MEISNASIDLDIEKSSELIFKVTIEGVRRSAANVRLVCEGDDMGFVLPSTQSTDDGLVMFTMPPMNNHLRGGSYPARIEVMIDDRCFVPTTFQLNFKKPFKVVAESVVVRQQSQPIVTATVQSANTQVTNVVSSSPPQQEQIVERVISGRSQPKPMSLRDRYENKKR